MSLPLFDNSLAKYMMLPTQYYTLFNVLVLVLLLVVLLLKGLALWRSARAGQNVWFWVFMFINTLGILEIVYLLTNKDELIKYEKQETRKEKKKFSFKIKRNKKNLDEQINLVEPEIAAINDLENR